MYVFLNTPENNRAMLNILLTITIEFRLGYT